MNDRKSYRVKKLDLFSADDMMIWDHFVAIHSMDGSGYFATSSWLTCLQNGYKKGHQVFPLAVLDENGEVIAGIPIFARRLFFWYRAVLPLLTPYTPFIVRENERKSQSVHNELLNWLTANHYCYISYHYLDCWIDNSVPSPTHLISRKTYIIDLNRDISEIWNSIVPSKRRQIRKSERENVRICDVMSADIAFDMLRETFEKRGEVCPVTQNLFDVIFSHSNGTLLAAYSESNQPLGYLLFHLFKGQGFYTLVSSTVEGNKVGVPSRLVWECLKICKDRHAKSFDFVGGNIPSIAEFKRDFGAVERKYRVFTYRSWYYCIFYWVRNLIRRA